MRRKRTINKRGVFPDQGSIQCQFCNEQFTIPIDRTAGDEQSFEYDCEICCRPLVVLVKIDRDGVVEVTTNRGD